MWPHANTALNTYIFKFCIFTFSTGSVFSHTDRQDCSSLPNCPSEQLWQSAVNTVCLRHSSILQSYIRHIHLNRGAEHMNIKQRHIYLGSKFQVTHSSITPSVSSPFINQSVSFLTLVIYPTKAVYLSQSTGWKAWIFPMFFDMPSFLLLGGKEECLSEWTQYTFWNGTKFSQHLWALWVSGM